MACEWLGSQITKHGDKGHLMVGGMRQKSKQKVLWDVNMNDPRKKQNPDIGQKKKKKGIKESRIKWRRIRKKGKMLWTLGTFAEAHLLNAYNVLGTILSIFLTTPPQRKYFYGCFTRKVRFTKLINFPRSYYCTIFLLWAAQLTSW